MKLRLLLVCLALWVFTLAVYWPARHFEFINLDDANNVSNNPLVLRGLSIHGLVAASKNTKPDYWRPVSWASYMIDTEIYGVDSEHPQPFGYHLTNIILHATGAVMLMLALHSLTGAFWRSAAVAALFAIHPLRVESVAWITERKDVLSGVFAFASLWAYGRYARNPGATNMMLTVGLLALGVMSKSMLVTWPLVFLLLDYWPLGRLKLDVSPRAVVDQVIELVREKIPLFAVAAASILITVATASKSITTIPLEARFSNVVISFVRYLGKMFWPVDLTIFYPYPGIGGAEPWKIWQVIGAAVILLAITVLAIAWLRKRPYVIVGWLWFLGMLVPVIGLVQVGDQGMADRFSYLPGIGITILAVWLTTELFARGTISRLALSAAFIAAMAAFVVQTRNYLSVWHDTDALYQHALAVTNYNRSVRSFYGDYLYYQKRYDQAITQFAEIARMSPKDPEPHYKLGWVYSQLLDYFGAEREFSEAVELDPSDADAHYNLAMILWRRGKLDLARIHLDKAVALNPRDAQQYNQLRPLLRTGEHDAGAASPGALPPPSR